MDAVRENPPPAWAEKLGKFNHWLMFDMGGGPRPFKLATVINVYKGATFAVMALLMAYYADQTPAATSTAAWLYLAMHGSYGILWVMKDLLFPDRNWQQRATIPSGIASGLALTAYWLAGWVLISGLSTQDYPLPKGLWFTLCVSLCILGCSVMIAADVQKFATLKVKRGLITDGMFTWIRHPNYLGEMMVYGSLALLAWHWIPFVVLAYFWLGMFSVNMTLKEASMSRYPDWAAYKQRTWWLLPPVL